MTLPSKHRIRNSTLVVWGGHPSSRSQKLEGHSGAWTSELRFSKQTALATAPGYPPTGSNPNSTSPPLKRSPSHTEKGETRIFLWKIQAGSEGFEPWTHVWLGRQSGVLPKRHVPFSQASRYVFFSVGLFAQGHIAPRPPSKWYPGHESYTISYVWKQRDISPVYLR